MYPAHMPAQPLCVYLDGHSGGEAEGTIRGGNDPGDHADVQERELL